MFKALVIACLIRNLDACAVIEDTVALYKTPEMCYARAFKMAGELDKELSEPHVYRFKCVRVSSENT